MGRDDRRNRRRLLYYINRDLFRQKRHMVWFFASCWGSSR